jgi:predicted ATPase
MFKTSMELFYDEKLSGSVTLILSKILPLFGLPSKFKIHYENDFGFQFSLIDSKGNPRNIADYGSGINQLLPVILAASTFSKENPLIFEGTQLTKKDFFCKSIIIVEEPESNLHPNMQSKLADMFTLLLNERNQNFIIETHSEYLVRRFQNLIASGKLNHENIIINYFWNDDSKHNCKQIQFREDGGLDDTFENGFFDESLMLELDLLKIKNLN